MKFFPLSKEQAIEAGFRWSDFVQPQATAVTIDASELPEDVADAGDDLLETAIVCEVSKRPFRLVRQELEFYRKNNIALPRRHPDVRLGDFLLYRSSPRLWKRSCSKSAEAISSSFTPESSEQVYCESCYLATIY